MAAALEGFAGSIDDVDPMKVHDLEVTAAFRSTERELSGLGFRSRYPQST
ncbi:MAG TPA: hypothetical protein VFO01_17520 [Trebonia sp.]|nr:hypothetical protein [Trebonia sp.]